MENTKNHVLPITFTQMHILCVLVGEMCKLTQVMCNLHILVNKRAPFQPWQICFNHCKAQIAFKQTIFSSQFTHLHCPITLFSFYFSMPCGVGVTRSQKIWWSTWYYQSVFMFPYRCYWMGQKWQRTSLLKLFLSSWNVK